MPRKSGIGTGDYQIAELSVGLELDLKQLDLDAAVADKTVLEMITKMNHRAKQIEKTPVRVSRGLLLCTSVPIRRGCRHLRNGHRSDTSISTFPSCASCWLWLGI